MSALAIALVWERMVELAEAAHDEAVSGQRAAEFASAQRVAETASALYTLAQTAVLLSREDGDA
jgi:hypothetical protein